MGVVSGGGGGGAQPVVLSATVALSSADILALHTTPITVVAGTAGFAIAPINCGMRYTFGGTAYNEGGGGYRLFLGSTFATSGWGGTVGDSLFLKTFSTAVVWPVTQLQSDVSEPLTLSIRTSSRPSMPGR